MANYNHKNIPSIKEQDNPQITLRQQSHLFDQLYLNPQNIDPHLVFFNQHGIINEHKNWLTHEKLPIGYTERKTNVELFKDKFNYYTKIQRFMKRYRNLQNIKYEKDGNYCFYNWISNLNWPNQPLQGLSQLTCYILEYKFELAIKILNSVHYKSSAQQAILGILKTYSNILRASKSSLELSKAFMKRQNYAFNSPDAKIMLELKLIHDLIAPIKITEINNDYYRLILMFLKNTVDPIKSNIYLDFLCQAKLLDLPDRINFAEKILNNEQKGVFARSLELSISQSSNLSDMLYFRWDEEEQLIGILQNFLDQYGDLETISIVCQEYNNKKMDGYVYLYNQSLIPNSKNRLFFMNKVGQALNSEDRSRERMANLFIDSLNFREQKFQKDANYVCRKGSFQEEKKKPRNAINQVEMNKKKSFWIETNQKLATKMKCSICFVLEQFDDLFVCCVKCNHGGHASHLMSWFQKTNACPQNNCACFCNT